MMSLELKSERIKKREQGIDMVPLRGTFISHFQFLISHYFMNYDIRRNIKEN